MSNAALGLRVRVAEGKDYSGITGNIVRLHTDGQYADVQADGDVFNRFTVSLDRLSIIRSEEDGQ